MKRKPKFNITAAMLLTIAAVMLFSGIAALLPPRAKPIGPDISPVAVGVAADNYASKSGEQYKYIQHPGTGNTGSTILASQGNVITNFNLTQEQFSGGKGVYMNTRLDDETGNWAYNGWFMSGTGTDKNATVKSSMKNHLLLGFQKPAYSRVDMQRIVNGESAEVPVILLDNQGKDQFVLFELTQLAYFQIENFKLPTDTELANGQKPSGWIKFNGQYIDPAQKIVGAVEDANYAATHPTPPTGATLPNRSMTNMGWHELDQESMITRGAVDGDEFTIAEKTWSPFMNYIAYNKANTPTLRAMLTQEGLYEFHLPIAISGDRGYQRLTLDFSFYIVDYSNYVNNMAQPGLGGAYKVGGPSGPNEEYSYVFHGDLPVIQYDRTRYDINDVPFADTGVSATDGLGRFYDTKAGIPNMPEIQSRIYKSITTQNKSIITEDKVTYAPNEYNPGDPDSYDPINVILGTEGAAGAMTSAGRYDFSTVGNYMIKSVMIYRNYRGEYVQLKQYTGYTIVLNIYGFQPYYALKNQTAGQDTPENYSDDTYEDRTPFWDNDSSNDAAEGNDGTADATTAISLITDRVLEGLARNGNIIASGNRSRYSSQLAYPNGPEPAVGQERTKPNLTILTGAASETYLRTLTDYIDELNSKRDAGLRTIAAHLTLAEKMEELFRRYAVTLTGQITEERLASIHGMTAAAVEKILGKYDVGLLGTGGELIRAADGILELAEMRRVSSAAEALIKTYASITGGYIYVGDNGDALRAMLVAEAEAGFDPNVINQKVDDFLELDAAGGYSDGYIRWSKDVIDNDITPSVDPALVAELEALAWIYNGNGNVSITEAELDKTVLSAEEDRAVFDKYDANADGKVTLTEFLDEVKFAEGLIKDYGSISAGAMKKTELEAIGLPDLRAVLGDKINGADLDEIEDIMDIYDLLWEGVGINDDIITLAEVRLDVELAGLARGALTNIIPVVTNYPPVTLSGNVDFAIGESNQMLSMVAFHGEDSYNSQGIKQWEVSALTPGKPFAEAGEYVITLYFYASNKLQRQTFYFRINNTIEILFEFADENGTMRQYTLAEVLSKMGGKIIPDNEGPIVVTFPDGELGAYQVAPIFELRLRPEFVADYEHSLDIGEYMGDADGAAWEQDELPGGFTDEDGLKQNIRYELKGGTKRLTIGAKNGLDAWTYFSPLGSAGGAVKEENGIDDWNGTYTFSFNYGAFNQAGSVVQIVLDTSGAGAITATPSNAPDNPNLFRLPDTPKNTAIFGISATETDDRYDGDDLRAEKEAGLFSKTGITLSWGVGYNANGTAYSLKPSSYFGIGFDEKAAVVDYWEFTTSTAAKINDFGTFKDSELECARLYSGMEFHYGTGNPTSTSTIEGKIVQTNDNLGWKIDSPFTAPGLYRIKITDQANIITEFILIIDNTRPGYVQDIESTGEVNMIDYDPTIGVKIGFGRWKTVTTDMYGVPNVISPLTSAENPRGLIFHDSVYDSLKSKTYGGPGSQYTRDKMSILGDGDRGAAAAGRPAGTKWVDTYNIPIVSARIKKDGEQYVSGGTGVGDGYPTESVYDTYSKFGNFIEDNEKAFEQGYFLLKGKDRDGDGFITQDKDLDEDQMITDKDSEDIEGTYTVEITDALGNVVEMYIILSHDKSMGTAFADTVNSSTGVAGYDAALVDVKGGLANNNYRPFVTFSFKMPNTAVGNGSGEYNISYIDVYHYELNWLSVEGQFVNQNYPFARNTIGDGSKMGDGKLIGRWRRGGIIDFDGTEDGLAPGGNINKGVTFVNPSGTDLLPTAGQQGYIQLFQNAKPTNDGLYQIVRHYDRDTFPGKNPPEYDKRIRDYYFVVDGTEMLEYSTIDYQTMMQIKFGVRADDDWNKNVARASDFNTKRNALESNLAAKIRGVDMKFMQYPNQTIFSDPANAPAGPNEYDMRAESYTVDGSDSQFQIPAKHYFSALVPRYSISNNSGGKYIDAGRGTDIYPEWEELGRQSEDINYNLMIQDGGRAMVYNQTETHSGEMLPEVSPGVQAETSANYGVLKMRLDVNAGSAGDFRLNGVRGGRPTKNYNYVSGPVAGSTVIYSKDKNGNPVYTTVMNPNNMRPNDALTFEFRNDQNAFISIITPEWDRRFWEKTNGLGANRVDLTETRINFEAEESIPVGTLNIYKYFMTYWDNTPRSAVNNFSDSDRFTVTLTTVDNIVTTFVLIMDSSPSTYNVKDKSGSIKDADTIARNESYDKLSNTPTYVYGLDKHFIFTPEYEEDDEDYYFGVKKYGRNGLTYNPIDPGDLQLVLPGESYPYSEYETIKSFPELNIGEGIPFASMSHLAIQLPPTESRYYMITETDWAGNRTQYIVQIKGRNLVETIIFESDNPKGGSEPLTPDPPDGRVFGVNMAIMDSGDGETGIDNFWKENSSFRIECDENNWYYAFDDDVEYCINGVRHKEDNAKDKDEFKRIMDTWIDQYGQNEERVEFVIWDRFGTEKTLAFYNINHNTELAEMSASHSGPMVNVIVSNYEDLPAVLTDGETRDQYRLDVWESVIPAGADETADRVLTPIIMDSNGYITGKTIPAADMNLPSGTQILNSIITNPLDKDLLIRLTDPFGRETYAEYHGQNEVFFDLKYYGNTVEVQDTVRGINKIMVGDKRGVELRYTHKYFGRVEIHVYPNGQGVSAGRRTYPMLVSEDTGITSFTFTPETLDPLTGTVPAEALYEIIVEGTLGLPGQDKPILYHEFFQFNTQTPLLTFSTLDNPNNVLDETVTEVFDGGFMYIDMESSPFGGSVSFTRTHNGIVDRFTIPSWMDVYTLGNPGQYRITARSSLWAEKVYYMEVIETSGDVLSVVDTIGGESTRLTASPVAFSLTGQNATSVFPNTPAERAAMFTQATLDRLPFTWETKNIEHYIFPFVDQVVDYYPAVPVTENNPSGSAQINNIPAVSDFYGIGAREGRELVREQPVVTVPPINIRQIIGMKVGDYYTKDNYFYMQKNTNTLIWCMARPIHDGNGNIVDFVSPIYFATTGLKENSPFGGAGTVDLVLLDIESEKDLMRLGERYRLYTPTSFRAEGDPTDTGTGFPKSGIKISMKYAASAGMSNPSQSADRANVLRMEYFKDGVFMGTVTGNDSLIIKPEDAGRFDFYIYDMVGNYLRFGAGSETSPYIDHYTLINLSKPFVVINNSTPVSGAVYNDSVNLYVTEVAYAQELYKTENFNKYFYISNFTVLLDGVEQMIYSIPQPDPLTEEKPQLELNKHDKNRFTFTARGKYEVNVRYRIGESQYVKETYTFQIVPSIMPMEQFEYIIPSNIRINKITRNGYNISGNYDFTPNSKITFAVTDGVGEYTVYGETVADAITRSVPMSFRVSIDRKTGSGAESIWVEGVSSGGSTDAPVTLQYRPYRLYSDGLQRPVTLVVYNNGIAVADDDTVFPVEINETSINALKDARPAAEKDDPNNLEYQNTITTAALSGEGQYVVVAFDADNDVMWSYSFSIVGVQSKRGIVVGTILGGVVLIMVFVFLRIRARMKVK